MSPEAFSIPECTWLKIKGLGLYIKAHFPSSAYYPFTKFFERWFYFTGHPNPSRTNGIESLECQDSRSQLCVLPSGLQLHFILLFIIGSALGEYAMLGRQEVEHVKGAFPGEVGEEGDQLHFRHMGWFSFPSCPLPLACTFYSGRYNA